MAGGRLLEAAACHWDPTDNCAVCLWHKNAQSGSWGRLNSSELHLPSQAPRVCITNPHEGTREVHRSPAVTCLGFIVSVERMPDSFLVSEKAVTKLIIIAINLWLYYHLFLQTDKEPPCTWNQRTPKPNRLATEFQNSSHPFITICYTWQQSKLLAVA